MRKVYLSIILFIIVMILFCFIEVNDDKVELVLDKCVDGDTAWFYLDNERIKVRFLGIDTPESTNYVEEYGKEVSDYTCHLLTNAKDIYLEYDLNSDKEDKYGRVLGWVFVDNNNLSELLLSKGYAEVRYIYNDYKYIDSLCKSQEIAYLSKLGIWSTNKYNYNDNYCNLNK